MRDAISKHVSSTADAASILFVFGAARSGTTYLTNILDDYFDFGMSPEGHFVVDFARRVPDYGDLGSTENMDRLLRDVRDASTLRIMREEWPRDARIDVSVEDLRRNLTDSTYPAVVFSVFGSIAERLGKRHIGTKNPGYTANLPMLESMFPGRAKYINVVRDGRDVALSTMRMPWGQKSVYACAKVWSLYVDMACAFEETVGATRFINVRYEDLLSDPELVISKLEKFLGIDLESTRRDDFLSQARNSGLAENFSKWRTAMTNRDAILFEAVAGRNLHRWGYESVCEEPSIGVIEKGYYEAHELWRKIVVTFKRRFGSAV